MKSKLLLIAVGIVLAFAVFACNYPEATNMTAYAIPVIDPATCHTVDAPDVSKKSAGAEIEGVYYYPGEIQTTFYDPSSLEQSAAFSMTEGNEAYRVAASADGWIIWPITTPAGPNVDYIRIVNNKGVAAWVVYDASKFVACNVTASK